ncbi:MAG: helix-turn-helix transcriptional regulator, partial [Clostridiales bacterium]|nr:helix-turn-helix transcriptional regulator [Clostridiales bacterium]
GKTTAVREALFKSGARVLWQNVYEAGAADFWHGFCNALSEMDGGFSESLRNMGIPNDYRLIRETLDLLQKLNIKTHTFLVIDDYHLIKSVEADKFISIFLRSLPQKLHLIIITRNAFLENEPDLKMKRLINNIRMEDLMFSHEDIAEYYRLCGIRINDREKELLYARSEGWVSALYLIMLDYTDKGVFTTNSDIPTLVRQVVYLPLSPEMKDFLNHICVFDAFTLEQAGYMWQKDDSELMLEALVKRNAFIMLDNITGEYHLHNIFSAGIRDEFSRLPEQKRNELWQRAGHWQALKKEYVAAMDCYYKAGDFEHLVKAFEKDRSYTTIGQYKEKMVRYLSGCPMEIRRKHHYAFLVYARLLYLVNEQALFGKICPELLQEIREDTTIDEEERNTLLGEFQLMISFSKYNSIKGMGDHFMLADKLMKAPSTILDTISNWTMGAPSILYMFYREKNSLDKEIELMRWGLDYYHRVTGGHGLGAAEVFEAESCFMRGDFDRSEILVYKALAKADETKQWSIILCAVFQQMRNALMRGDYMMADSLIKNLRDSLKQQNRFTLLYSIDICSAYLYALLGQAEKAPLWIIEGTLDGAKLLFTVIPALQMVQSRLMLEQKQFLKLLGMSEQFSKMAGIFPNLLSQIYLNIHMAAAYIGTNRPEEAAESLKKALATAMPDRLYMPFVENGAYIGTMLWSSGPAKAYEVNKAFGEYAEEIETIRKLYQKYQESIDSIKAAYFEMPTAKLTEREEEVAALAAAGLPNREISRRLFVSENTVKAHLKSTFEKLSIKSRAQLADHFKSNKASKSK